jgi:hypothetical protein
MTRDGRLGLGVDTVDPVTGLSGLRGHFREQQTLTTEGFENDGTFIVGDREREIFRPYDFDYVFRVAQRRNPPQTAQIIMVPIDADKLKKLIKDRLNYGDCAMYVANLINKAAELTNGANPAKSTNIMALFDEIRGQSKGGVLFQPSGAPHPHYPNLQLPAGGGGWAWGLYAQGNATINVPRMGYYSDRPEGAARIPYTYGANGLHEVIHLSGKFGTYSDGHLTQAARLLEPNAGIGTGDQAWGEALKRHCVPPKYR